MEFGAHMSSSGGIDTAIDRIQAAGGDCVQVFTQSPRMRRRMNHKPEAVERFHAKRSEAGIGGVVAMRSTSAISPTGRRDLTTSRFSTMRRTRGHSCC